MSILQLIHRISYGRAFALVEHGIINRSAEKTSDDRREERDDKIVVCSSEDFAAIDNSAEESWSKVTGWIDRLEELMSAEHSRNTISRTTIWTGIKKKAKTHITSLPTERSPNPQQQQKDPPKPHPVRTPPPTKPLHV